MRLNDNDLKQLNEEKLASLDKKELLSLSARLLADLKELYDRLNQTSNNSSRPSGSMEPWKKTGKDEANAEEVESLPESQTNTTPEQEMPPVALEKEAEVAPEIPATAGKQAGTKGFGHTQVYEPNCTEIHRPEKCVICDKQLADLSASTYTAWNELEVSETSSTILGINIFCTRHLQQEIVCTCGHRNRATPYRAPDDKLWEKVPMGEWHLFGARFASITVMLAFRMRMSRSKISEFWHDICAVQVSTGTVNALIAEAGRACAPIEEDLVREIQQSALAYVDETSWKENGKHCWLWVFVTVNTILFTVGSRGKETFARMMLESAVFKGILMSDGYSVYRDYSKRLRCWAHLIRKAQGLFDSIDTDVNRVGKTMLGIFKLLVALIFAARDGKTGALDALKAQSDVKLKELRALCELHRDSEHKKLREFSRELLNDWDVIFSQVKDPHLPLTNNEAERALRHWVIARRISYGTRTPIGTKVFTILASVIETCRLRKHSPLQFLSKTISDARSGIPVQKMATV